MTPRVLVPTPHHGSTPGRGGSPGAGDRLERKALEVYRHRPGRAWDFVITVCDRARETCPNFPGRPLFAHWGIEDPAGVEGARLYAFREASKYLGRRIDLMLALPFESLETKAVEERLKAIGHAEEAVVRPRLV